MKHIGIIIAVLWLLAGVVGCSGVEEPVITGNTGSGQKQVSLQVNIPGANQPDTRSMAGTKENEVTSIDILVFKVNGSNYTFHEHVQGTSIVNKYENNKYTATFKAQLEEGNSRQLVIVANASQKVAQVLAGAQPDETKGDMLLRLTYSLSTGKWLANGTGAVNTDYMPIPMYGETGTLAISNSSAIPEIPLTRMLARIDVINQTSNFTLNNIYLVNRNTTGYIHPRTDGGTGVNLPASTGKITPADLANALKYALSTQSCEGEIYTFEAAAPADNNQAVADATCLILEGVYEGTSYFYRVDLTKENTSPTQYLPLLRNYQYRIVITEAAGIGYRGANDSESFNLALNSYTVPSNLKTRMISYDMSVIKNIVYNGQYMLGVNNAEITITKDAKSYTDLLKVHTDNPSGWTATVTSGGSWLTLTNPTSGNAGVTASLGFTATANPGPDAREAVITLTAGRLTHTVTIRQTYEKKPLSLRIVDENGLDITELIFDTWYNGGVAITPQVFKLLWEPEDAHFKGTFTATTPSGATIFSYTASSDNPTALSAAQVTAITGGEKSFSIQPPINTTANATTRPKASTITFTLEDDGVEISKELTLKQNVYYIASTGVSNPYDLDGNNYYITLRTNSTAWELKSYDERNFLSNPASLVGTTGGNNDRFYFDVITLANGRSSYAAFTFFDPTGKAPNHTTETLTGAARCGFGPYGTGTHTLMDGNTYTLYPMRERCYMVEPIKSHPDAAFIVDGIAYFTYETIQGKNICEDISEMGLFMSNSTVFGASSEFYSYTSYLIYSGGYTLGYYERPYVGGSWSWKTDVPVITWGRVNWLTIPEHLVYSNNFYYNETAYQSENLHAYPIRCNVWSL